MTDDERKAEEAEADEDVGWICGCGHFEQSGLHCSRCGNEPPWGCPCSGCQDGGFDDEDCGMDDLDAYGEEW